MSYSLECSALKQIQIPEVFYYAQKAVLHPTAPLFDQEAQTLKPRCVRALKRIFILCDNDRDGSLSDAELNDFQVKCFNAPLQPSEIVGVKRVVQEKLPEGVNENGLTLMGFLFLHALFIEKGRLETTWTVLRKFGYSNEIRLTDDLLLPPIKRNPDQNIFPSYVPVNQAECDELAQRAEVLKEENASPRAEVSRIRSEYEQLLAQNATLKERLGEAPGKDDMRSGNEQHMGNENQQSGETEEHVQSGH